MHERYAVLVFTDFCMCVVSMPSFVLCAGVRGLSVGGLHLQRQGAVERTGCLQSVASVIESDIVL